MGSAERKHTRLAEYNYSKGGYYFVTICTLDKRHVFGEVVGGDAHIAPRVNMSKYGEIADKYIQNIEGIDKYSIMPNHIHMIIKIIDGPMRASAPTRRKTISDRIRSFKIMVTKQTGSTIWQRSFYDHIIRSEQEYLDIWRYIDENPTKWAQDKYF